MLISCQRNEGEKLARPFEPGVRLAGNGGMPVGIIVEREKIIITGRRVRNGVMSFWWTAILGLDPEKFRTKFLKGIVLCYRYLLYKGT